MMKKDDSGLRDILNALANDIQIQNVLAMDDDQVQSYSNGKKRAITQSLKKQGKGSYAEGITTIFESILYPIIERLLVLKFPHKDIIQYIKSVDDPVLSKLKESTIKGYIAKLSTGINIAIKSGKVNGDDQVNKVYEFLNETVDEVEALQEMLHLQKERIGIMAAEEQGSGTYHKGLKDEITTYTRMLKDSIAIKDFYGVGDKGRTGSGSNASNAFNFSSPELIKSIGGVIKNKESSRAILNFINVALINAPTKDNAATEKELQPIDDTYSPEVQAFLNVKKEILSGKIQNAPDEVIFETGKQQVMLPDDLIKKDARGLMKQVKEMQRIKELEDAREESSRL